MDALKVGVEDVANLAHGAALLLIQECGRAAILCLGDGVFPALEQNLELAVELGGALVLGRCADDHAEVLRLDALDEPA